MQSVLAPALTAVKGYTAAETVAAYERSHELLKVTDDRSHRRETIVAGLFAAYFNQGAFKNLAQIGREFLYGAERQGDRNSLCVGCWITAVSENIGGQFQQARVHAERALASYDPMHFGSRAWSFSHDISVSARVHLSIASWHLGYPDQSAVLEGEAVALASRLGHKNTMGYALFFQTLAAFRRRDFQALGEYAIKLQAHGREHAMPPWTAIGSILEGPTLAKMGRAEQALQQIEAGLAWCDSSKQVAFRPAFLCGLAEAQLAARRAVEAVRIASEALELAELHGECWMFSEICDVQARAQKLAQFAPEHIEKCLHRARAVALEQGSKMLELRASTSLAQLWRDEGKLTEARDLLAPIYGWFTEGFDTPDLKEAKTLLDELVV
jgi:predicted ATPase